MDIQPCDDEEKHDPHNPTPTTWCPGANGAPKPFKPTYVVTVHDGGGSMVEAADPVASFKVSAETEASLLCEGINQWLRKQGQSEMWATYLITQEPPLVQPGSPSWGDYQQMVKDGKVPPGHVGIDLKKIVDDILEDR